jgi:hypothetical protein
MEDRYYTSKRQAIPLQKTIPNLSGSYVVQVEFTG